MFSIGFNFNYDCREFTEVSVNANGVLSFGNNTSPYEYGDGYYTAYMGDFEKCNWDGSCLLYTSPSPRDRTRSRMPSSA